MDTKARDIAQVIHAAFAAFRADFSAATAAAHARFATADWAACGPAAKARLEMYEQRVAHTVGDVRQLTGSYVTPGLWYRVKQPRCLRADSTLKLARHSSIRYFAKSLTALTCVMTKCLLQPRSVPAARR